MYIGPMTDGADATDPEPADQAFLSGDALGAERSRRRAAPPGTVPRRDSAPRLPVTDDPESDAGRLCGYRGCQAALPQVAGPGNRAKYCQDDKRWGPKALTCKQA